MFTEVFVATKTTSLDDLYVHQLKDLYSAEKHLVNELPKMAKAASSRTVQAAREARSASGWKD